MTYDARYSLATNRPPLEDGTYDVLLQDGQETTAIWRSGGWDKEGVVRYSGKDVRVTDERQLALLNSILAGTAHKQSGAVHLLQQSQSAALELARHWASRGELAEIDHVKAEVGRKNALICYGVAKGLGATFGKVEDSVTPAAHNVSTTDRALVEAYIAEFPYVFQRASAMIGAPEGRRSLEEWTGDLIVDLKAKIARKAARAARRKPAAAAPAMLPPANEATVGPAAV